MAAPELPRSAYRPWPEVAGTCSDSTGGLWRASEAGLTGEWEGSLLTYSPERHPVGGGEVRDVAADPSDVLWIATDRGVTLFDGHSGWRHLGGRDGLPVEDVRRVLLRANGERWFATGHGVVRLSATGEWSLFCGPRWLPEDDTIGLAEVDTETVAVLCRSGETVGIRTAATTLAERAATLGDLVASRHTRRGYVTECMLERPGDTSVSHHIASDNDGLWTSMYVAAECFRYAVTGAEEARDRARASMQALLWLERVTGIAGFPARAAVAQEEMPMRGTEDGEWHPSPDGEWLWKGDTSSDELNGHYFALPIYYDLVAEADEQREIQATLARITDHLLTNDFCLLDADGAPTRWAVFAPRLLNYSHQWVLERSLNSLSILSFLRVAQHVCHDERYGNAYDFLARRHGYALHTIDQKITLPGEVNFSDDELAFLGYYPLLAYEEREELRALYRLSLERAMRSALPQRCPLWNVIASVGLGRAVGLSDAAQSLIEMPTDRIHWPMDHRARADVARDHQAGRFGEEQGTRVLPYSENVMLRWNGNPYRLTRRGDGCCEDDGVAFLLPYWMARYHGLLEEV